jgi:hypothetical protein
LSQGEWGRGGDKKAGFFFVLILVLLSQECPSGIVNEENFKQIYSQFFPQGGEGTRPKGQQLNGGEGSEGLGMPR